MFTLPTGPPIHGVCVDAIDTIAMGLASFFENVNFEIYKGIECSN
jgi:hypothetical protein